MKLIAMVDFVHYVCGWHGSDFKLKSEKDGLHLCLKYANFLYQPLTLGMYVPCDEQGNVLKDPSKQEWDNDNTIYDAFVEKYQQAKERVLFKGWTYNHEDGSLTYTWTHEDGDVIEDRFYQGHIFSEGQTIEKIVDDEFPMELTETAVRMFNSK